MEENDERKKSIPNNSEYSYNKIKIEIQEFPAEIENDENLSKILDQYYNSLL